MRRPSREALPAAVNLSVNSRRAEVFTWPEILVCRCRLFKRDYKAFGNHKLMSWYKDYVLLPCLIFVVMFKHPTKKSTCYKMMCFENFYRVFIIIMIMLIRTFNPCTRELSGLKLGDFFILRYHITYFIFSFTIKPCIICTKTKEKLKAL